MSHFCQKHAHNRPPKMFKINNLGLWHVACILVFMKGCYFWLPVEEEHPNAPPVIEYSSPEPENVFRIDTPAGSVAWVSVFDPDQGDVMEYMWTINGLGPQGTAQAFMSGNYQGSSIQLPRDPVYNGRVLTCTVYDPSGASDRRSWTIEVEEGS